MFCFLTFLLLSFEGMGGKDNGQDRNLSTAWHLRREIEEYLIQNNMQQDSNQLGFFSIKSKFTGQHLVRME